VATAAEDGLKALAIEAMRAVTTRAVTRDCSRPEVLAVRRSDRGGERAAVMRTLIRGAKLNQVDPRLGSPTCWPASTITPSTGAISCYPGIGRPSLPEFWHDESNQAESRLRQLQRDRHVRIELRYTDPLIWRHVEVPTSITLKVLHDIIQAVMVRLPPMGVHNRQAEVQSAGG
jgi:Plasmid pRiA4b ORF-3-like protein